MSWQSKQLHTAFSYLCRPTLPGWYSAGMTMILPLKMAVMQCTIQPMAGVQPVLTFWEDFLTPHLSLLTHAPSPLESTMYVYCGVFHQAMVKRVPYMVGNFCKVFIFAFFASQEPFVKIKTVKILLPMCKANKPRFNPWPSYFYTAAYKSVSASVPLPAITEVIQNVT